MYNEHLFLLNLSPIRATFELYGLKIGQHWAAVKFESSGLPEKGLFRERNSSAILYFSLFLSFLRYRRRLVS